MTEISGVSVWTYEDVEELKDKETKHKSSHSAWSYGPSYTAHH